MQLYAKKKLPLASLTVENCDKTKICNCIKSTLIIILVKMLRLKRHHESTTLAVIRLLILKIKICTF